jgi:hypothetical protein
MEAICPHIQRVYVPSKINKHKSIPNTAIQLAALLHCGELAGEAYEYLQLSRLSSAQPQRRIRLE